ncbi:hypothetical protein CLOM_g3950 [Closterium sp. NIES-68]|nr:hypothetical protein CLOM_g3950 [Closterium sp. NIES-68]GJP85910.1 hypothetical protein CLOP_g16002 [Closterium sp. NIES-67]
MLRVSLNALLVLSLLEIAAVPRPGDAAPQPTKRAPQPDLKPPIEVLGTCQNSGAINTTISPSFIGTTWRGWGTSLAWFANYVGGLPQRELTTILDLLFEPVNGLGLNIVRYNIGGGNNRTLSPQFYTNTESDWRGMPGFKPTKAGPYDWSADERQRNVLQGAKERGANVFEAFSNSPPWWMTYSGDVAGALKRRRTNLRREYEGAFADYLTTVVAQFAKRWGVTFDSLEPFNEALERFWGAGADHEGCTFNPPEMGRVIKHMSDSLKAKGLKTKLVGVDSWYGETSWLPAMANHELLTRINVHSYVNKYDNGNAAASYEEKFGTIRDTGKQLGREVWVSEAGPLSKRGSFWDLSLYVARNVIESINIMEASAYVIWQAYDFGSHWSFIRFPSYYRPPYDFKLIQPKVNRRFWLFKHFTLLAKPGSKPIKIGSSCIHGMSAFYNPREAQLTVFIVNQQAEDRRVTLNLEGFKTNLGGRTTVVFRRTSAFTNFSKRVYARFRGRASFKMWGQTFVSVTFTNVSI